MSSEHLRIARELRERLGDPVVDPDVPEARVRRDEYTEQSRFEAEQLRVIQRQPVIVAHSSELGEPGQCVGNDHTGVPVILARGDDGVLRGFLNACRHRATRLIADSEVCRRKALVCPYHNWTYALDGSLLHIPHREAFTSLSREREGLVQVPVAERHGFVWMIADPTATIDLEQHLGPLDEEMTALGFSDHVLFETRTCERAANWKLVIDLFLEGYHIRTLHRDSIYPFFMDARAILQRHGRHVLAVSARRTLADLLPDAITEENVRTVATPSYLLFPNAILIGHPDFLSIMRVFPQAPDRLRWVHTFVIPEAPRTDEDRAHWRRAVDLIEDQVFRKEDLKMAEEMQRGLAARADDELLLGKLEQAVGWFHASVNDCLRESSPAGPERPGRRDRA